MSHSLTVELSDAANAGLERFAAATAASPVELAAAVLELRFRETSPTVGGAAERHFGVVDLVKATDTSNAAIDAYLASESGADQ